MQSEWKRVCRGTDRLPVPSGWVYRQAYWSDEHESRYSTCFVPDPSAEHVVSARVDDLLLAGAALAELAPDYAQCEESLQAALDAWNRAAVNARKGVEQ